MSSRDPKAILAPAKREWIRPRLSPGRFLVGRRVVGYALIVLFATMPFLRINHRPALLIDITNAELSLLGMLFRPSDGFLLMLLGLTVVATVLLVTTLFGRIWCGWGCPQTVYMEHVFRPLERWIEGSVGQQKAIDRRRLPSLRRLIGWALFVVLSFVIANIFLAYFVGTDRLLRWITTSPAHHPGGFTVVMLVTTLMFLDFAYFREQVCIVACPYGRLQSTLLDPNSLIVAYDVARGEPRRAGRRLPVISSATRDQVDDQQGSCIDCNACVATCPTGIDIRNGLQMECIGCAQCIDACDSVMDKIHQPRGLVRYSSQEQLAGRSKKIWRPRTVIYPALLVAALALLITRSDAHTGTDVWVLRVNGALFVAIDKDTVASSVRLKLENKGDTSREYSFALKDAPDAKLRIPIALWNVKAHHSVEVPLFVDVAKNSFVHGQRTVLINIFDGATLMTTVDVPLLGPEGPQ